MRTLRSWARALVPALVLVLSATASTVVAEGGEEESDAGRSFALLIGCTEYPALRERVGKDYYESNVQLDGCENDVALLRRVLTDHVGLAEGNIRTLAGWPEGEGAEARRPTRANILSALEHLAKTVRAGDRVIVHFSGHGIQIPDDDEGEESDFQDEALLPADGDMADDPKVPWKNAIRDDEWGDALRKIRDGGAHVWLLMDCCHSGSSSRGIADRETKFRRLRRDAFGPITAPAKSRGLPGARAPHSAADDLRGITAFYAAQSYQEVPELKVKGPEGKTSYGLLTYVVAQALQRSHAGTTFHDIYQQAVGGYCALRKHKQVQPLAEGDLKRTLGGSASATEPPLTLRRAGTRLVLDAGSLYGVAAGAELDVFAPGGRGQAERRVGTAVVEAVEVDRAFCTPTGEIAWATPPEGTGESVGVWPVEVTSVGTGPLELPVAALDESGTVLSLEDLPKRVRAVFATNTGRFPLVGDPSEAYWHLVVGADRSLRYLTPARAGPGASRFAVTEANLEARLRQSLRAENLLALVQSRAASPLPPRFALELVGSDGAAIASGSRLRPGEPMTLRLRNEFAHGAGVSAAKAFDVHVFWIDPTYGIWLLFPEADLPPRVSVSDTRAIELGAWTLSDESPGLETILVLARPVEKDAPQGDLSYLAAEPMELAGLAARTARGAADDPLDRTLRALAFGRNTRGPTAARRKKGGGLTLGSISWQTGYGVIRAPSLPLAAPRAAVEMPAHRALPGAGDGAPPSAWAFGGEVSLGRAGSDGAHCVLVSRSDDTLHLLLDVDGEVEDAANTPEGLRRLVTDRAFDAEIVVRVEGGGKRTAWYDTDDDGDFDLVLVDEDTATPQAEVRYVRRGETWLRESGLGEPFLTTAHLRYLKEAEEREEDFESRVEAIRRIRSITEDRP